MLYTFSQSEYDLATITQIWQNLAENDAVLFWQNGVTFWFKHVTNLNLNQAYICLLKNDVEARGLMPFITSFKTDIHLLTLTELVDLTEKYYPQLAF